MLGLRKDETICVCVCFYSLLILTLWFASSYLYSSILFGLIFFESWPHLGRSPALHRCQLATTASRKQLVHLLSGDEENRKVFLIFLISNLKVGNYLVVTSESVKFLCDFKNRVAISKDSFCVQHRRASLWIIHFANAFSANSEWKRKNFCVVKKWPSTSNIHTPNAASRINTHQKCFLILLPNLPFTVSSPLNSHRPLCATPSRGES